MGAFTRRAVAVTPVLALMLIISTDTGMDYLRRMAIHCVKTVYATEFSILKIPEIPANTNNNVPAYIALCQYWLNDEANGVGDRKLGAAITKNVLTKVGEQDETCRHWGAPHLSILDMASAIVVSQYSKQAKYRHNCAKSRAYDEAIVGYDHATIQQVIASPGIGLDESLAGSGFVKNQCRRCLMYFNPQIESTRIKSKSHQHCFAWPDTGVMNNVNATKIPILPTTAYVTPLSMVVQPILQRHYHAAVQWRAVVDKPPLEEQSGVVIYVDQLTMGVGFKQYLPYITPGATSITVLAGPLCAKSYLKSGQLCKDYVKALVVYLNQQFPTLSTAGGGVQGGPSISFQIVAASAAISSRIVLAQRSICAPHTTSCYLPALSRTFGSSIVLEDPTWNKAIDFFTMTGHRGWVTVAVLSPYVIPARVHVNPPLNDPTLIGGGVSQEFTIVNTDVDDRTGFPTGVIVPKLPTDGQVFDTSDYEILDTITNRIGTFESNVDVHQKVFEQVPSLQYVKDAYSHQRPIRLNVDLGYGWGGSGRMPELALDIELALGNNAFTPNYLNSLSQYRRDSMLRIKQLYKEEDLHNRKSDKPGQDPGNVFEIKCPTSAYSVPTHYGDHNGDYGRRRRMVKVDARTFKFGETLERVCAPEVVASSE